MQELAIHLQGLDGVIWLNCVMFDEVLMCVEYLDLAWTTELSELKFELDWRFLSEFGVDVESHWQFLDLQVNKGRNHMTKLRIYMDLCV